MNEGSGFWILQSKLHRQNLGNQCRSLAIYLRGAPRLYLLVSWSLVIISEGEKYINSGASPPGDRQRISYLSTTPSSSWIIRRGDPARTLKCRRLVIRFETASSQRTNNRFIHSNREIPACNPPSNICNRPRDNPQSPCGCQSYADSSASSELQS